MFHNQMPDDEPYQPPPTDQERRRGLMRQMVIRQLLDSLRPQDARMALFSFAERKYWGLKSHQKRPSPA